ncbi:MAG: hypothetical protein Q7T56_18375 [Nocardioidaceae bacterium]|nr:hypothetical protein [Nocardioidaceae bacterium]
MTTSTRAARTLAAAAATSSALVLGAVVATPARAVDTPPPVSAWELSPGRIGPVAAGMTRKQLVRSGTWVRTRGADCEGTIRPRDRYLAGFGWYVGDTSRRLESVVTSRRSVRTTRGIAVGDTLAAVRRAYPSHLSRPRRGIDQQWYVVHRAGTRYLAFGLDRVGTTAPGGSARVVAFSVSRTRAYAPYLDGCGF